MSENKLAVWANSEDFLQCPVCGAPLKLQEKSLLCANRHCYDIAKQGYVNLVLNGKQVKNYSKAGFANRQAILERGYYAHILQAVQAALQELDGADVVLDAGCGEGYYARKLAELPEKQLLAFDIAKESVLMAAKSDAERRVKWFVGDLAHLPLQDDSVDCILNIFSPANQAEFTRVLRPGGYIIKVIPANDHLKELRQIAQAHLKKAEYSNAEVLEHFEQQYSVMYKKNAAATIAMPQEDIRTFADMTPLLFYVDVEKLELEKLAELTIAAEVLVAKL